MSDVHDLTILSIKFKQSGTFIRMRYRLTNIYQSNLALKNIMFMLHQPDDLGNSVNV